jgi:membrane-bound inhibitor of C-type lysozyme
MEDREMKTIATTILLAVSFLTARTAWAVERGTIPLQSKSRIERTQTIYDCGSAGGLTVTYVNADPNFLAIVPVPKQSQQMVFASVIAGSGSRYAAGKYIWWTKGSSASLYDITLGDNAPPILTCNAIN